MSLSETFGTTNKPKYSSLVNSMENRNAIYEAKKREREAQRTKRRQDEIAKKQAEEKKRNDRLLNMKVPEASLRSTITVENRHNKIQQDLEAKLRKQKEEIEYLKKKEKIEKQTSNFLTSFIKQKEIERKQNFKGFVELTDLNEKAAEAAMEAKKDFRKRMVENKRRIDAAISSRPTLIERHEMDLAKRNSKNEALAKVAKAFTANSFMDSKSKEKRALIDDNSLFDDEEKFTFGSLK